MTAPPTLLTLFVDPTGALLYFLAMILITQAALFMALGQRLRGSQERAAGRYLIGAIGVLLCWTALMIGGLLVLLTHTPSNGILPPLDRALTALLVLIVGWTFATADAPTEDRPLNILFGGLAVIVLIGFGLTEVQWLALSRTATIGSAIAFNTSSFGLIWTIIPLVAALLGLAVNLARARQNVDVPLKLIFFGLVAAGCGYTLYGILSKTLSGDDSGAIRLAMLAALPIMPVAIYRLVIYRLTQSAAQNTRSRTLPAIANGSSGTTSEPTNDREAVSVLKALGGMLERDMPDDMPQQIVIATANALKADVVALIALDDAEYADVIAAYDNIQQKPIAAMALKLDEQPTLLDSVRNRGQRTLSIEHNLNELVDLYTRLDIQRLGTAYFQPLLRDGMPVAALMVGLPYTQRQLRENEMRLLGALAPIAARLLSISRAAQRAKAESGSRAVQTVVDNASSATAEFQAGQRQEMQSSLEVARGQISELGSKVRDLQIELDYERSRLAQLSSGDAEGLSISQKMQAMSAERSALSDERERLAQALQEAQTSILGVTARNEDDVYGTMIDVLQKERDDLQAQKAQLEAQLDDIRKRGSGPAPAVVRRALVTLSEEKAHLLVERNHIASQLAQVSEQLKSLGIEGPSGLVQVVAQLTEERAFYKLLADKATQDRDILLTERQRLGEQLANESARESKFAALEDAVRRLAQDREAIASQRDALRQERDNASADAERWMAERTRLVAEMSGLQAELEEAVFERNRVQSDAARLLVVRAALEKDRDQLAAERTSLQTERNQLRAATDGNRELLQRFGDNGVDTLKVMIDDLTEERSELEHKVLRLQAEIKTLQGLLQKAKSTLSRSIPLPTSAAVDASQAEVMLSIAQELRTPMSSIIGYVDLLLGESVGILGALQRQFLQRVKANVDRLGHLLEDFVRVTAIDTGQLALQPANIDVTEVIDDAITQTRMQFREKGITLKMDVPNTLPTLNADRDALQQIVIQLLSNAYLASPTDGEVSISARHAPRFTFDSQAAESADVIYLAVHDQGAGIPKEEQMRVFSRLYRADNPLIQGLGDTGVGLSIARALTEMHGGRIWLESAPGGGSTFKLILPLAHVFNTPKIEKVPHAAA